MECDEQLDDCIIEYVGGDSFDGYSFDYTFVEGLEEGTTGDELWDALSTPGLLEISVTIENDYSACEIAVDTGSGTGYESCTMCSPVNCENSFNGYNGVMYDCTNLENGKASTSECESLEPIFYPFGTTEDDDKITFPPGECPEDIIIKRQTGYTEFPVYQIVEIVSQDIETVTVKLNQAWTTAAGEISAPIDHIYASFHETMFDSHCYETESVDEGYFDTYTITCNVMSPKVRIASTQELYLFFLKINRSFEVQH